MKKPAMKKAPAFAKQMKSTDKMPMLPPKMAKAPAAKAMSKMRGTKK